jgi:hypothetical protein
VKGSLPSSTGIDFKQKLKEQKITDQGQDPFDRTVGQPIDISDDDLPF